MDLASKYRLICHEQNGQTALIAASLKGNIECVRLILDCGADLNVRDSVRIRHSLAEVNFELALNRCVF